MGAKRVTTEEIVQMHELYKQLGTYAAVGEKIWRSGSTVSRYIRMEGTPEIVKTIFKEVVEKINNII